MRVCALFLVLGLVVASSGHVHFLSFLRGRLRHDPKMTCTTGDVHCGAGCKQVMLCLADNEEIVLSDCGDDKLCDATDMTCKTGAIVCKSPPDEKEFRCHATGLFSNPYDCHSYFDCNGDGTDTNDPSILVRDDHQDGGDDVQVDDYPSTGTGKQCDPPETAFDPLSSSCRLTSTARVCKEGPIPKCVAPAQNGALVENPNIYYVCVNDPASNSLVPWVFKCPKETDHYQNGHCQTPALKLY